jgi:hypothetical protein
MNAKISVPAVLLAMALPALAQNSQTQGVPPSSDDPAAIMRADPYLHPPDMIPVRSDTSTVKLGNGDYVISGPIVQGINRAPAVVEQPSVWKRIVLFPLYLVTPQPMPSPPEKTDAYFKWSQMSTQPWTVVAGGHPTTDDPAITDEPVGLISVSR